MTFLAGILLLFPGTGISDTVHVSPDGDDANPGSELQPLRSLAGARDRVRGMDKHRTQDVTVLFRAGDYFTDETVGLGEQDSGVNGTRVSQQPPAEPVA